MSESDDALDQAIAANLAACRRFDDFERDEAAWDEIWEGSFAILVDFKKAVLRIFELDPRRSALYGEFPELLAAACDPQQPILYDPVFREFGYPVFDGGPSYITIPFDPWTGKTLPASLRDAFMDEAEKRFGPDVGLLDPKIDTLPKEFHSEAWWVERGL